MVDSWKDSVLYLMNKQKLNLVEKITEWQRSFNGSPITEIDSFQLSLKMVGISNADFNNSFNRYIEIYSSAGDKFSVKKRLIVVGASGIGGIILGLITLMIWGVKSDTGILAMMAVTFISIVSFIRLSAPKELKEMNELLAVVKNGKLSNTDFNLAIKQ